MPIQCINNKAQLILCVFCHALFDLPLEPILTSLEGGMTRNMPDEPLSFSRVLVW